MRTSDRLLKIARGGYKNIKREKLFCGNFSYHEIEDENHLYL